MAERVLTLKELNRATLARQLLLDRKRIGVLAAIERLAGLQAQWPPSPYVGLWSRLAGFKRSTLERALRNGEVVKPSVMRGTLHLVTARDYPVFWSALRDMADWYDETHLSHAQKAIEEPPGACRARAAQPRGRARASAASATATRSSRRAVSSGALRRHAHLLHSPDSALWKSRPLALFVQHPAPEPMDVLLARVELVRRYLARLRPRVPRRHRRLVGPPRRRLLARARRARAAAPLSRRERPRAPRPAACAVAARRHARARAIPPELGQHAARARRPSPRPARGAAEDRDRARTATSRRRSSSTASSRAAGRPTRRAR